MGDTMIRMKATWSTTLSALWNALVIFPIMALAPPPAHADTRQACHAVSRSACDTAHALGRGINLGNMLDAPREGDWGVRAEPALVELAASQFQTVRLPVRWSNHAAPTADATIDEAFARRVDVVIDTLLARGVRVMLDVHHYSQVFGDPLHPRELEVKPSVVDERLVNLWRQIAHRYRHRSPACCSSCSTNPTTGSTDRPGTAWRHAPWRPYGPPTPIAWWSSARSTGTIRARCLN